MTARLTCANSHWLPSALQFSGKFSAVIGSMAAFTGATHTQNIAWLATSKSVPARDQVKAG